MCRIVILVLLIICFSAPQGFSKEEDLFNFSKKQQENVLVVKVSKSDTVVLEDGRRIKLIGIESAGDPPKKYRQIEESNNLSAAPVIYRETEPETEIPLEVQAVMYAKELMEGKKVTLEFDSEVNDSNGYKIAYLFLPDGRLANAELLKQGMVRLKIRVPNVKYADQLRAAYQEARRDQRGFLAD